jgi:hypothetical protein
LLNIYFKYYKGGISSHEIIWRFFIHLTIPVYIIRTTTGGMFTKTLQLAYQTLTTPNKQMIYSHLKNNAGLKKIQPGITR